MPPACHVRPPRGQVLTRNGPGSHRPPRPPTAAAPPPPRRRRSRSSAGIRRAGRAQQAGGHELRAFGARAGAGAGGDGGVGEGSGSSCAGGSGSGVGAGGDGSCGGEAQVLARRRQQDLGRDLDDESRRLDRLGSLTHDNEAPHLVRPAKERRRLDELALGDERPDPGRRDDLVGQLVLRRDARAPPSNRPPLPSPATRRRCPGARSRSGSRRRRPLHGRPSSVTSTSVTKSSARSLARSASKCRTRMWSTPVAARSSSFWSRSVRRGGAEPGLITAAGFLSNVTTTLRRPSSAARRRTCSITRRWPMCTPS